MFLSVLDSINKLIGTSIGCYVHLLVSLTNLKERICFNSGEALDIEHIKNKK